jgi:hypothetical protein
MTDDLEPRLRDHLDQRARRVSQPPDVADLHDRIDARQRRTTRALGAALAVALLAGPVLGFALARSTESDRDTLTASGGDQSLDGGQTSPAPTWNTEGFLPGGSADLDYQLDPVSARTTADGIRLVVHSTDLGQSNGPCMVDGWVRVGIVDGDLVDVLRVDTAPGGASFLVGGAVADHPMWVVVVRGYESVEATFPNGATDAVDSTDGLAVLAAYAEPGDVAQELADDVIELQGRPMVDMEAGREAWIADGYGGCGEPAVLPPTVPVAMPEPGEQPADPESARAEVEELFLAAMDGAPEEGDKAMRERPNVWWDAQQRFREEHPDYYEWSHEVYSVVHEIVFTAPDRASVRYSLTTDNPSIPAPGERIGEAVLIDGTWRISIETACGNLSLAAIQCDYSIEG